MGDAVAAAPATLPRLVMRGGWPGRMVSTARFRRRSQTRLMIRPSDARATAWPMGGFGLMATARRARSISTRAPRHNRSIRDHNGVHSTDTARNREAGSKGATRSRRQR
jgi:hypothetical protein